MDGKTIKNTNIEFLNKSYKFYLQSIRKRGHMEDTNLLEKKIGFIILTWNSENVIGKCLNSILSLKCCKPMIIVIDNGSNDSTINVINRYMVGNTDSLKLIKYQKNMGTTISRNAGIKSLKKENINYYCVLDSDTEVNDRCFEKLMNEMEENDDYGIIGPKMFSSDGTVQMSARAFPTLLEKIYKAIPNKKLQHKGEKMEEQFSSENLVSYPVDYLMSACWLIKPEVINTVGLLDEKIFYAPEDAEYCICVWKAGYKVAYCPDASMIHEWQRLSKKKLISKINWEHIKGLIYMFKKHKYLFNTKKLRNNFKINKGEN